MGLVRLRPGPTCPRPLAPNFEQETSKRQAKDEYGTVGGFSRGSSESDVGDGGVAAPGRRPPK